MSTNYFQGDKDHAQHLSVGGVLLNDKGEVCCHHFIAKDLEGYWVDEGLDDFYLLMRETLKPNESLEGALHRGLAEEFGATAEMIDYIGSIRSTLRDNEDPNVEIEKTTIYFLCKLIDQDPSRRKGGIESKTKLEWHTPDFLIPRMKEQAVKYNRTDVDESAILEKLER